jgi:hypothetical protein
MKPYKKITGRVLYIDGQKIYRSQGHNIFLSTDNGNTWLKWATLPVNLWYKILMGSPLLARLFRKTIHHLAINDNFAVIIANKESYIIENDNIKQIESLHGSRPMVICATDDQHIYYGEYRSNLERSPIHIRKLNIQSLKWEIVWRFEDIQHVHGIFHDPYKGYIWVTTGDKDSEAGIWYTKDSFVTLEKIVSGSQQTRAVQLLFTENYIYFGSDTQKEINFLYRINRIDLTTERLESVGSSVFYGCKIENSLFFSTAIEPSDINKTHYVELWRSDNGTHWYKFLELKKDIWSMKYFQYGQILFPSGHCDSNYLYFTPFATINSGKTFVIDIHNHDKIYL